MTRRPMLRVVKVGGSLFECDQLPVLLSKWLAPGVDEATELQREAAAHPRIDVLIAGGGALVDHVRQLDQRFELDEETAHWMSVGQMSCTARLLARLLNLAPPVRRWDKLTSQISGGRPRLLVFDVHQWLAELEPEQPGTTLNHDWQTTSDAIAGRLAQVLDADELVLLKSTDNAYGSDWQAAAAAGLVDELFPQVSASLREVEWVNLRGERQNCP